MSTAKVLVAANHPVVWQSLVHVLRTNDAFEVTGRSLDEAAVTRDDADVTLCVIDPHSGVDSPLEDLLADIRQCNPDGRLICLFLGEDDNAVISALRAGASGIIEEAVDRDGFEVGEIVSFIER